MRNLFLVFFLLFSVTTLAEDTPQVMLKIIVHYDSPGIPKDAFIRQPKVIYRAGSGFCRVEEALDADHGLQQLLVVNEPDSWIVNLVDKKGQHVVDPGPTFNCHLPIFSGPPEGSSDTTDYLKLGLEFGSESAFFTKMGATSQPGPVLQSKQTTSYVLDFGDIRLTLYTIGLSHRPLALGRVYQHKGGLLWYSDYGLLPFDPKLFSKPEDVSIQEPKP
jgi:hypothetical protein